MEPSLHPDSNQSVASIVLCVPFFLQVFRDLMYTLVFILTLLLTIFLSEQLLCIFILCIICIIIVSSERHLTELLVTLL